jgi:hypothetical protein
MCVEAAIVKVLMTAAPLGRGRFSLTLDTSMLDVKPRTQVPAAIERQQDYVAETSHDFLPLLLERSLHKARPLRVAAGSLVHGRIVTG